MPLEPQAIRPPNGQTIELIRIIRDSNGNLFEKRLERIARAFRQWPKNTNDTFRDETSDADITILVPPLIRNELQPNKTVTVNGFVTRRVINTSGSIQLTVTDLVEQTRNKYNDNDLKKIG
jgi:hypothetical protein